MFLLISDFSKWWHVPIVKIFPFFYAIKIFRKEPDFCRKFSVMCLSFLGQILFGIIMAGSLGLTLASMFTPGLRFFIEIFGLKNLNHFFYYPCIYHFISEKTSSKF